MEHAGVFLIWTVVICSFFAFAFSDPGFWRLERTAERRDPVFFLIGLKQRNIPLLKDMLAKVSTPGSDRYRKYLSKDEITSIVEPSEETRNTVLDWLRSKGLIARVTGNNDFIRVKGAAGDVARAFGEDLSTFKLLRHERSSTAIVKAVKKISVPDPLSRHIDIISGISTEDTGAPRPLRSYRTEPTLPVVHTASRMGEPIITVAYSSQNTIYPKVLVTCLSKNSTRDAKSPCSDAGTPISHFVVKAGDRSNTVSPKEANCTLDAGVNVVMCTLHSVEDLEPYRTYSISVKSVFSNGVTSLANTFYNTTVITSDFVTPQILQNQYSVPLGFTGGAEGNLQSVAEFGGQYFSPNDLNLFFANLGVPATSVTIVGPNNASQPGDESTLDIQWIMALGQRVPTVFWSIGHNQYLIEWAEELSSSSTPPLVNSISYSDNEEDTSPEFMKRFDNEVIKLGARGVSVIVAAGDAGATNIGHGSSDCSFSPQYPSSSPYVTSVGATMLTPAAEPVCHNSFMGNAVTCSSPVREAAVSADAGLPWTTGGGFSTVYPRPAYQADAVRQYLNTASLPPSSMFNSSNRAYPDVSAIGHNLIVFQGGLLQLADGTSASTPIFAGIISLLNSIQLSKGKPPLGFLNPALYAAQRIQGGTFFDVTVGNNKCGDVLHPPHTKCCAHGYNCANGFDAVTGLGTPNFEVLAAALMDLS